MPQLDLQFLTGARRGSGFVSSGQRVRIGRSRDNDLVIPDEGPPAASRHHAEAVLENGRWWLVDLHSANGTTVNGRRVSRHALRPGDRVQLGGEEILVRIARGRPSRSAWVLSRALLLALGVTIIVSWRSEAGFERAADLAARATYLMAVESEGRVMPVGTAFAITRDGLLATNAHVAHELQGRTATGGRAVAVRAERQPQIAAVHRAWLHPRWKAGSIRDDVALVRLERGVTTAPLSLAGPRELQRLSRGTPIGSFGFPAVSTDPRAPHGRLTLDVIGELRGDRYLGVGLRIAPGTSGSPIFIADGTVVAMVTGGDFMTLPGRGVEPTGSATNWGVSAAAVSELLESVGAALHTSP